MLRPLQGCGTKLPAKHKVTFLVLVKNPAVNQKVYLTGNRQELADWQPDKILMEKVTDSTFVKTFVFNEGTGLEFKITQGLWWLEALDENEQVFKNQKIEVQKDTVIKITVYEWKNTFANGKVVLNEKRFRPQRAVMIVDNFWRYHPGDNPAWAVEDCNDGGWPQADSYVNWDEGSAVKWNNVGWFRFHFIADTTVWNKSLALHIGQLGASQIFYNGRLLYSFGEIGQSKASFRASQVRIWKELKIDPKLEQVIAVRYANYNWREQKALGFLPGFVIYLKDINTTFQQIQQNIRDASYHQAAFTIIPLILFFLHIFIYSFNPKRRENLFYAFCLLGFAGLTYFNFEKYLATDPDTIILLYKLNGISIPVAIFFGLMTYFSLEYIKIPKRWKLYFAFFIFISVWNFYSLNKALVMNYIFFGIAGIDLISSSFGKSGKKKIKGSWIVGIGSLVLIIFVVFQLLTDFSIIPPLTQYNQVFVYGMIGSALSMSVFLSYNFSTLNKDLAVQLEKVQELSEKTIQQERAAGRLELERCMIETENKRKTKELEDARLLQLSLLPKEIPVSENIDIAFFMNTATEVGGDYYDVISEGNGNLTVALGDATGHGVKAGIMVAVIKGLLHELEPEFTSAEALEKMNTVIRSMQVGSLYMGLTMLKIRGLTADISIAGMPPVLLYREKIDRVEEIIIKRMPLGATDKLRFEDRKVSLGPGDILLLFSDGLSELFNKDMEMFDFSRIKDVLISNADKTCSQIISELKSAAEIWRNGFDQADDLTIVALKCIRGDK